MLDLVLITMLGFLGSFGHCIGMCGPLAVAFSFSYPEKTQSWQRQLQFHILLNLGRVFSYALVGTAIGILGSALVQGGQLGGVGSDLRRWIAIITGMMLIWLGLAQVKPHLIPKIPIFHPLLQNSLHNRLSAVMVNLSLHTKWWTPALLGMTWGLMPCGFLYAAQIKAAATGNGWHGAITMLAFGLGTLPTMLGVSVSTSLMSKDQRGQLFRLGGWVSMIIGIITISRTGETMVDYSGYAALICLILALIARPMHVYLPALMRYRRGLGVGAFLLSLVHTIHKLEHLLAWNLSAVWFLPVEFQWGMGAGVLALIFMTPAAFTSFDFMQKSLGPNWRRIHLLTIPALILTAIHAVLIGSTYLGALKLTIFNQIATLLLIFIILAVLMMRSPLIWSIFKLKEFYTPLKQKK